MLRQMSPVLLTTLVAIIVIIVFAVFFRDDGKIGRGEIGLELGVPLQHNLASPQLPVVVRLVNNSDSDVNLKALNSCKIFRYIITWPNGTFKQASGDDPLCSSRGMSEDVLAAQSVKEEIQIITLDRERFEAGTYALQIRYWGYDKAAQFKLVKDD